MSSKITRAMGILAVLIARPLDGMSNSEIADKTGLSRPVVSRDLADLVTSCWVEQRDDGKYAPSPKLAGLLMAHNANVTAHQQRISQYSLRAETAARRLVTAQ